MKTLYLETKEETDTGDHGWISITPSISKNYWSYRVQLTDTQAMLGFPKFGTIGIGFAVEEDWNTNLPYTVAAKDIYEHVKHNKGDKAISRATCIAAIEMIRTAAYADRAKPGDLPLEAMEPVHCPSGGIPCPPFEETTLTVSPLNSEDEQGRS